MNIPRRLLRVAKSIDIAIDIGSLSVRTHNAVARQVRSGVVVSGSVSGDIAQAILNAHELPYVTVARWGRIRMHGVPVDPDHPLRRFVREQYALTMLQSDPNSYRTYPHSREVAEGACDGLLYGVSDISWKLAKELDMGYDIKLESTMVGRLYGEGNKPEQF
jgi:hypothetical protein